ncbi:MAG: galactose mutarotase, partial [Bacteroidales bacterium]|nr:galactose mutarotase [Bacteroidales bacterium]
MERPQAQIKHFAISNAAGGRVVLSNLGAGIVSIEVPDKAGVVDNVALTYAKPEDWMVDGPCAGKIPGRYANRIAASKFSLGGKEYSLAINNGPNHLHGGPGEQCYANRIWDAEEFEGGVRFILHSPDGDAGYPGALDIQAVYTFSEDNVLRLEISAKTDAPTVVNLTNHVYFNLRGQKAFGGDGVRSHLLKLYASRFLPGDSTLIPFGVMAPVAGTPMDFTVDKPIGQDLDAEFEPLKFGKGYDHCWCIDAYDGTLRPAAELSCAGRKVAVFTNQPGVQVYTGNWLCGCPGSPDGYKYKDYDCVALECQA